MILGCVPLLFSTATYASPCNPECKAKEYCVSRPPDILPHCESSIFQMMKELRPFNVTVDGKSFTVVPTPFQ